MKFVLLVEGDTEARALPKFLKRWLDPQLRQPVGIDPINLGSWSVVVNEAQKRTRLLFNDRRQRDEIIAVIGLIDLYGPNRSRFYPAHLETVEEKYVWAKQHIEGKVNHPRYRQFFAVHEVEAWLLSEPTSFPREIADALPAKVRQPEKVDFDQPPKQLLSHLYRTKNDKKYHEIVDGVNLFSHLNPQAACAACPYLRATLEEMLKLARDAGL